MLFVIIQERFFKFRKLEKVIFFFDAFGDASAFRASRSRRGIIDVHLVPNAVVPFVVPLVDIAVVLNLAEEVLDGVGVAGFGGSNETVDTQAQFSPEGAILGGTPITEIARRFSVVF